MINKKQDQTLSAIFKPKSQQQHQSFIKQYQSFLQKTRKAVTPVKEATLGRRQLATSKQSTRNSPSPVAYSSNYASLTYFSQTITSKTQHQQPLFKPTTPNPKELFKKIRSKTSVSPPRPAPTIHANTQAKEVERLFECDSNPTKSSTSFEKSVSAVSIFQESTKQLEELQAQKDKPELQKGIAGILSLIKKEKQVILNDMKQMTRQMNKYKTQYEELVQEHDLLQRKLDIVQDGNELQENQKERVNETYAQMIQLLRGLQVEYQDVLPELGEGDASESQVQLEKDETIILQKLIIKKLVKKIEDLRQLNSLLITKLKEQ